MHRIIVWMTVCGLILGGGTVKGDAMGTNVSM